MFTRRLLAAAALVALGGLSPAAAEGLEEQMRNLERIRGLRFSAPVQTISVDRSELPRRLREQFTKTLPYSEGEWEMVLRTLHLVDDEKGDLIAPLLELYQAQVLAWYDPLSRTYYSIRQAPEALQATGMLSMLEEGIVIHELMHALQDQQFAIGKRDLALRRDTDANFAFHAFLEGEATLVMLAYLADRSGASVDDLIDNDLLLGALTNAASADVSMGAAGPRYFREMLKFPYLEGLRYVIAAYKRGGWGEINRLHATPPGTTREILHPEESSRPGTRFSVSSQSITEHLGEFHWSFLVGAENARGWVDDSVTIAQNRFCEPTVLVDTRWESPAAAERFAGAYSRFLESRGEGLLMKIDGTRVRIAYGSDRPVMDRFVR
jgi:hypothetical protein